MNSVFVGGRAGMYGEGLKFERSHVKVMVMLV